MSSQPVAYTIDHEGLSLDIALAPTVRLLIHEETIPTRIRILGDRIKRDGVQSAPIIVDRGTYVVLDGMHRTAIMAELGCRFTCVCLVDYRDPRIKVQRWCRAIPGPFSVGEADEAIATVGLTLEPIEPAGSLDQESSLLLVCKDQTYRLNRGGDDLLKTFKRSHELEKILVERGHRIRHLTEAEAQRGVESGEYGAALFPPKVEKRQVVETALQGMVFTPKATRHRLPARPVQVNVPLQLLRDQAISLEEANERLRRMLKDRRLSLYEPGAEWMGRTYDETLYVFEP
jgi:hypothetical protein